MVTSSVVSPGWLRALSDAAAVILLLELTVLLVIVAVLIFVLAFGARWLQMHVVPVLNTAVPAANRALEATNQSTDRVVHGVAEVYGIRRGLETALQILLFGRVAPLPASDARSQGAAPVTEAPPPRTHETVTGVRDISPQPGAEAQAGPAARPPLAQQPPQQPQPPTGRAPQGRDLSGMAPHAG